MNACTGKSSENSLIYLGRKEVPEEIIDIPCDEDVFYESIIKIASKSYRKISAVYKLVGKGIAHMKYTKPRSIFMSYVNQGKLCPFGHRPPKLKIRGHRHYISGIVLQRLCSHLVPEHGARPSTILARH